MCSKQKRKSAALNFVNIRTRRSRLPQWICVNIGIIRESQTSINSNVFKYFPHFFNTSINVSIDKGSLAEPSFLTTYLFIRCQAKSLDIFHFLQTKI